MQFLEAREALARKLNIEYTKIAQNALFSDDDLKEYVNEATKLAWAHRLWDFTLDALKFAWNGTDAYFDYPNTFEDRSIYLLTVNDLEWRKRKFPDFKRFFSVNPTATNQIWAEFKRQFHVNTNALSSGDEICVYGKLRAPKLVNDTDLLPFSPEYDDDENSGNDAVIDFAYSFALASEKKKEQGKAELERKKGYEKLDKLWEPMDERESVEQHQDRSFFEPVPDFFGRNNNIGNF